MTPRSVLSISFLTLALSFGGVWLYIQGWQDGAETVREISPVDYLAQRQAYWQEREDLERAQEVTSPQPSDEEAQAPAMPDETNTNPAQEGGDLTPASVDTLCNSDFVALAEADLAALEQQVLDGQSLLSPQCGRALLQTGPSELISNYIRQCNSDLAATTAETLESLCLETLPQIKAFATSRLGTEALQLDRGEEQVLREQLVGSTINLSEADLSQLKNNIALANRFIESNPESYLGYKAKLINTLLAETKFGENPAEGEYNELYEELLPFRDTQFEEAPQRGEAFATLEERPQEIGDLDPDLVHIPFLRLAALDRLEDMGAMASEYRETYPQSYIGYLYGAESLWRQGEEQAALNLLSRAFPEQTVDESAFMTLFEQYQQVSPTERITQMGLGTPASP